ncbi:MAG TPA: DUF3891 family protein [Candidatus Angelobacter sp.]|nr:DUF3891 family protein [Candidatus Angelobacter sp.]
MILRPLEPAAPALTDLDHDQFVSAWPVVERLQKQNYESCWMITQPSHAALSGEIAARLTGPAIPKLDGELVRAIALHDAGWGIADAQAVTRSRSARRVTPRSFLETEVAEFLDAWTQSIQVAQSVGPAGGFIVSRHFQRLAEHRMAAADDSERDRKNLQQFVEHEGQRQKKFAAKQERKAEELELLTDVLQFCDLLSLYICCGAGQSVEFPECRGVKARLTVDEGRYKLDPPLVEPGSESSFAALRYPATKDVSSKEISVKIG